jgi:hypothetical protein
MKREALSIHADGLIDTCIDRLHLISRFVRIF